MKVFLLIAGVLGTGLLSGCSSITGLVDASDAFGCPIQGGVRCSSLTQTYDRAHEESDAKVLKSAPVRPPSAAFVREKTGDAQKPIVRSSDAKKPEKDGMPEIKTEGQNAFTGPVLDEKTTQNVPSGHGHAARLSERVMELWILPWVDEDGDLNGASRLWVRVRDARWGLESLRDAAMREVTSGGVP